MRIVLCALVCLVSVGARSSLAQRAQGPAPSGPQKAVAVAVVGQEPPAMTAIAGPKELSFFLPWVGRSLNIVARLGEANAAFGLRLDNGAALSLVATGKPPYIGDIWKLGGYSAKEKNPVAYALVTSAEAFMALSFSLPGKPRYDMSYYLKPNLNFYVEAERDAVAAKYPQFPSALTHAFTVRLERTESGLGLWLDGRFLGALPASANLTAVRVSLAKGNDLLNAFESPALRSGNFLPLDLTPYARPGEYQFVSQISGVKASAMSAVESIPFLCVDPKRNIDVGLSRWLEESVPVSYCDNDTTRSAFFGCPESIILQAPKENYIAGHVLCAVEPTKGKVPVLTLRVTRFGRNYGDSGGRCDEAFADTTIRLPGSSNEPLPGNVKKVGTIKSAGLTAEGREQTVPVYLVTVPLKMGVIPDLLGDEAPDFARGSEYLDIELTKDVQVRGTRRKPSGLPSAVHVFAMTLERNPVDVRVSSNESGNIFYAAGNPEFNVRLANTRDAKAELTMNCDITDYYGRKTLKTFKVAVPGKTENGGLANASIPLTQLALGYFDALITVTDDKSGVELWRQQTSFALLPPDTRKAGMESPFGTWWFSGSHGTCDKVEKIGPVLMKMGMRHVCPYSTKWTENDFAPYKLSYSMVPWLKDEKAVDAFIQKNPNVRFGMIFHENAISATEPRDSYPYAEFVGKPKPELSAKAKEELDKLWKEGEARAIFYRTKYPQIKISVGNTHSPLIMELIRRGFPKKYIDCIGMEGVSGWTTPENQPEHSVTQEIWWVREMQRIYGYDDIPVSSGYEYITRGTQRGSAWDERGQADMFIRDALHCLAYGYLSINIGATEDFGDSYNATIYGGAGFVRRTPLLTPKPSYVTWATMTQMLDSAKYTRYLDTGSRSLYALEFKRDNEYIYPIWTVRGKREMTASLNGAGTASLTDCMGNTARLAPMGGKVALEATTSPMYLVTTRQIEQITPGKATHDENPPANAVAVADFSNPSAWDVDASGRDAGKFTLAALKDPQMGNVAELTLEPQPEAPKLRARSVSLKLKTPAVVRREAKRMGLWVYGNSCWGNVSWNFVDANKEQYATRAPLHWDRNRWMYTSGINFDGWCFIALELPIPPAPDGQPGPAAKNWSHSGGDNDGIVQFPITVTRVGVAMRDWQVYVTDMIPSQSRAIRLGSLMAGD